MASEREDCIRRLRSIPARNESRVFAIDAASGQKWSFGAWHQEAVLFGARLRRLGLRRGDRLSVIADNSPTVALTYFGALYAGVTVVPLHPTSSVDEVTFATKQARVKCVLFGAESASLVREAVTGPGVAPLSLDAFAATSPAEGFTPLDGATADDELLIVFTSGTTSRPKGVVHRVRDLVDNARLFGELVGLGPENRLINLLAMTYLGGYYNLLLLPYANECSTVLGPVFSANGIAGFWQNVTTHQVNTLWLVPSIMSMLLKLDRGTTGEEYTKKHVRFALCGTAPLPVDLRERFEKRYGVGVYENYGLSETLFLSVNSPKEGRAPNDTGRVVPGVDLRVVDRQGQVVGSGIEGEVQVKTPSLMAGYLADDGGTQLPLEAGYFPTGDLGQISDGRLAITGRKKDLIIRGGVNISPASIEAVIAPVPGVQEVAVIGVPHPVMGEEIIAVIQRAATETFESVRLRVAEACSKMLARLKQPSTIVELAEFPKTTNGKVQKAKIRAWLTHGSTASEPSDPMGSALHPPAPAPSPTTTEKAPVVSSVVSDVLEAMSIKYNNMVYELKEKGVDVTVLSLGEAFFDIPLFRFDDLPFPALYHYSHSRGTPGLRKRLAEYFSSEYGVEFDPAKEIIITAGSKIAIYMALLATVEPGDEVLIHEPAWVSYFEQVKLCHAKPVGIPYDQELYDFEKFITPRTKVIVINNPNNPRGRVYSLAELTHLHQLAVKHNVFILADEAYSDFLLEAERFVSMANLDRDKKHTIVVNSISKNFGISGWRLGYLISNPAFVQQVLKVNQHLVTCPATVLEFYIEKHFSEIIATTTPQMRKVVELRGRVAAEMKRLGLTALDGDSTFYFFVNLGKTKLSSEQFCDRLLSEAKVCCVPGIGYGESCDRFIRVSVGSEPEERIYQGLAKIKRLIDETSV